MHNVCPHSLKTLLNKGFREDAQHECWDAAFQLQHLGLLKHRESFDRRFLFYFIVFHLFSFI